MSSQAYRRSGVDLDAAAKAVSPMTIEVESANSPNAMPVFRT